MIPDVELREDYARQWLRSITDEASGETVAAELDVDGDSDFGYGEGDFITRLETIVGQASSVGLFGPNQVALWPIRDADGNCDGGIITVDIPTSRAIVVRLASLHADHRDLIGDRDARGEAAAISALRAVAFIAAQTVQDARKHFTANSST